MDLIHSAGHYDPPNPAPDKVVIITAAQSILGGAF